MARNDDSNSYLVIPPNYQNSFTLLGFKFNLFAFLQGLLCGAITLGLYILLFVWHHTWSSTKLTFMVIFFALGFVPVARGFKGGTFFQFIHLYFRYRQRRRVAIYNAHLKTENKRADHSDYVTSAMVYKDQLALIWNGIKNKSIENEQKKVTNQVEAFAEYQNYYFEDDEDSIAKPEEYMTRSERRAYKKRLKKEREKVDEGKETEE